MSKMPKFTAEQLELLDKASLILLILEVSQQMAERIQALENRWRKTAATAENRQAVTA